MIIAQFHIGGITIQESETDPPLIVHRNRVLTGAVAMQRMQPIAGRDAQVRKCCRGAYLLQLADGPPPNRLGKSARRSCQVQFLRSAVRKSFDHFRKCNVSRDTCQSLVAMRISVRLLTVGCGAPALV